MPSTPVLPSDFPVFARSWAEKRLTQHVARTGASPSKEEVRFLSDWLSSLPTDRPKMVDKLHKLTWAQAMEAQTRWHEEMARRAGKRTSFGGAPDDVETVLDLGDGWRWVRVTTPEGLDFEGEAMGHCAGRGSYDDKTVYSLRGPDGMPHCTVQYDPDTRIVEQVKGRGNKEVVPRHHAAVRAFVYYLSPTYVRDAPLFGHVFLKEETWPKARLVSLRDFAAMKSPTIAGDLYLDDRSSLVSLPEGLTVGGNLHLSGCASLVSLPDGLTVAGYLHLYGCTSLVSLPEGLTVGGNLHLYGCTSLVSLADGLTVGRNLDLYDCPSLVSLPNGLTVGGCMDLRGCPSLVSLPDGLTVAGHLDLSGCASLVSLPNGLNVGGGLHLYDCTSLVSLPDGLTFAGDLRLSGCTSLVSLPDGLSVGRGLNLRGCTSLVSLPDGLTVGGKLHLHGCTSLVSLPDGMIVEEEILGYSPRAQKPRMPPHFG